MELTYTWALKGLKKATVGDLAGVVVQTYWTCTGTDADGVSGVFHGATPFDPAAADPASFTAFEDLTEEQVLSWIQGVVNGHYKDHVERVIAVQIAEKKLAVEEVPADGLPWFTPAE